MCVEKFIISNKIRDVCPLSNCIRKKHLLNVNINN